MKFQTQIYRASSPGTPVNVIVAFKRLLWCETNRAGDQDLGFDFEVTVFSDGGSGIAESVIQVNTIDFRKQFSATELQETAVYNRMRGVANLMANIRAFCKDEVLKNNPAATFTDLDDDNPI